MLYLVAWMVMLSLISFCTYWWDKQSAIHGRWRVAETTLHTIDLIGGWPGGLAARRLLRHKVRKKRYAWMFWTLAVVNATGTTALLTRWVL